MDSHAYILNNIKTYIYSLFRETCFLSSRKAPLISKCLTVMERPNKRDTCVDGTLTGWEQRRGGATATPHLSLVMALGLGRAWPRALELGSVVITPLRARKENECHGKQT